MRKRVDSRYPLSWYAFQFDETVIEGYVRIIVDIFPFRFPPMFRIDGRKEGVAGKSLSDLRHIQGTRPRHHGLVKRRSADHENFRQVVELRQRLFDIVEHVAIRKTAAGIATDDDIDASGQGPADGIVSLPSHQDGRTHRDFSEFFQVGR